MNNKTPINPATGLPWTEKEIDAELKRCADPVYFYNTYWTVNGIKPRRITHAEFFDYVRQYNRQFPTYKRFST